MNLQKQPYSWACMPTAFAMAVNIPVKKFIEYIGHDGSEIRWPNKVPPWNTRAFTAPECTEVAYDLGFYCHEFVNGFEMVVSLDEETFKIAPDYPKVYRQMQGNSGVIFGMHRTNNLGRHAVAWDGEEVFDPMGFKSIKEDYDIHSFYSIGRR